MGPREHYLARGATGLSEVDLLALVLGLGVRGASARALALALLERFGDVAGLARAEPLELAAVPGIGPAGAVRVHAALALAARAAPPSGSLERAVRTMEDAVALLAGPLRALEHEELHALYLDRRNRPMAVRALTRGSDAFTIVDPRQVFRPAVRLGALAVILAHNHPSGDPSPSPADLEVTRRVDRAGKVLGIRLLDHLVITAGAETSIAERGVLEAWSPAPITTAAC